MLSSLGTFVEREAGHIVISLLVIGVGAAFCKFSIPKGEDLIVFALGVMARSMVSGKQAS